MTCQVYILVMSIESCSEKLVEISSGLAGWLICLWLFGITYGRLRDEAGF